MWPCSPALFVGHRFYVPLPSTSGKWRFIEIPDPKKCDKILVVTLASWEGGDKPIFYNSPHLGRQVDTFEPAKWPRYLCWPSHLSEKGGPWKVGFTIYSQVEIHGMIRHHVRHHFYRYLSSKSKKIRLLIRKLHHQVALFTLGLSPLATTSAKFIGSENIAPKNTAPPPV